MDAFILDEANTENRIMNDDNPSVQKQSIKFKRDQHPLMKRFAPKAVGETGNTQPLYFRLFWAPGVYVYVFSMIFIITVILVHIKTEI